VRDCLSRFPRCTPTNPRRRATTLARTHCACWPPPCPDASRLFSLRKYKNHPGGIVVAHVGVAIAVPEAAADYALRC